MVDALERARGWLGPDGRLVDVHPAAEPAYLEVQLGARIVGVGRIDDVNEVIGTTARHGRADAALADAVAREWFAVEQRREFSFRRHADTVDEMRAYVNGKWKGAVLQEKSLQHAAALLRAVPGAQLWVREQVHIARLRPIFASTSAADRP
jgi:hypothetical protein